MSALQLEAASRCIHDIISVPEAAVGLHLPMLRVLALFLLFMPQAFAAESLDQSDYVGNWTATRPVTKGESNTLSITDDLSVSFARSFPSESLDQRFTTDTDGIQFVGDIAIIELYWESGELAYKLVLSGWRSSQHRMIFGTMYLYRDGKVFNGLPVSFELKNRSGR